MVLVWVYHQGIYKPRIINQPVNRVSKRYFFALTGLPAEQDKVECETKQIRIKNRMKNLGGLSTLLSEENVAVALIWKNNGTKMDIAVSQTGGNQPTPTLPGSSEGASQSSFRSIIRSISISICSIAFIGSIVCISLIFCIC